MAMKRGDGAKSGDERRNAALIQLVTRAIEDPRYWNALADDPQRRLEIMREELGSAPTVEDMRALDDAIEMMRRLNERFGPKPIAS
jgi:hypothetical protein